MLSPNEHRRRMANYIAANGAVPAAADNTVAPVITGTAAIGQTLSVSDGMWTGEPEPTVFQYQWRADGVDIVGANASTFEITDEQFGATITAEVRAIQHGGYVPASSAATAAVTGTAPSNSVAPAITGTAQVGQTLTASTGTWSGAPADITYTYQWLADAVEIADATESTYVPVVGDIGAVITVTVTATNAAGSDSATSAGTSAVIAA